MGKEKFHVMVDGSNSAKMWDAWMTEAQAMRLIAQGHDVISFAEYQDECAKSE
jgi:hypothetical protein